MSAAGEGALTGGVLAESRFSAVDYTLFSLMLVVSIGIGVHSAVKSRGRESTREFMLGGGTMSPYPVALSLLGGVISAISILGNPTEVYLYGTQICGIMVGVIPGCLLIHQLILPIFYTLQIVSVTQYVEMRYKSQALRKLASVCNLATNCFYMGLCLYAPSLALSAVTNLSTWASMLIMGSICTFYISVGGVKAVVYTDVMQTLLMFGGVVMVVVICCIDLGGIETVWKEAELGGRIEFLNLDPSIFTRHTLWSTIVLGFYFMINKVGLYQPCFQRFASVGNLKVAQRLCIGFVVGLLPLWTMCYLSGLVAYAAYRDCDPLTAGRIQKPDQIIPYMVMDKLARFPGLPGVFVAAVYGGVLSSLSSCGNSASCLIWEDFLKHRPYFARLSNTGATNIVKFLSAAAGLSTILLGLLVSKLGNVFHVSRSVSGSIMGPMQGVFLAGTCMPWVNTKGAVVGFLVSFLYNISVVVGNFLRGGGSPPRLPLSIQGCLGNTSAATLLSTPGALLTNTSLLLSTVFTGDESTVSTPATELPAMTQPEETLSGNTVYDISYCYFGVSGVVITMVVSGFVSLCTGPLRPGAVDERLLSPSCARLHRWLWRVAGGREALPGDQGQDKEVVFPMLSGPNTNHGSNK